MKPYELLLILSGALKESEVTHAIGEIKKLFEKHGVKITEEALWGRLKLSYEIKHQTHGTYVLWRITIEPANLSKFDRELRVSEGVLRFLLTEQPKNKQPITVPKFTDERRDLDKGGKKGPANGGAVDKSKPSAAGSGEGSGDTKRSLDEILEEKI